MIRDVAGRAPLPTSGPPWVRPPENWRRFDRAIKQLGWRGKKGLSRAPRETIAPVSAAIRAQWSGTAPTLGQPAASSAGSNRGPHTTLMRHDGRSLRDRASAITRRARPCVARADVSRDACSDACSPFFLNRKSSMARLIVRHSVGRLAGVRTEPPVIRPRASPVTSRDQGRQPAPRLGVEDRRAPAGIACGRRHLAVSRRRCFSPDFDPHRADGVLLKASSSDGKPAASRIDTRAPRSRRSIESRRMATSAPSLRATTTAY